MEIKVKDTPHYKRAYREEESAPSLAVIRSIIMTQVSASVKESQEIINLKRKEEKKYHTDWLRRYSTSIAFNYDRMKELGAIDEIEL